MGASELEGVLVFLRAAERLKDTLRTSHTTEGRRESVAEHTWRLCQTAGAPKSGQERADLVHLTAPLPPRLRDEILELWDEYEAAVTPEARLAKALDKLETVMQHNQGKNPPDFDYAFNLGYGRKHTQGHPLIEAMREVLDRETQARADAPKA